jgi:hypothetical protein
VPETEDFNRALLVGWQVVDVIADPAEQDPPNADLLRVGVRLASVRHACDELDRASELNNNGVRGCRAIREPPGGGFRI